MRPDGSIRAYQKGFTKQELKDWCEQELGDGYVVEIANKQNAGGTYDTAVVITKNNESATKGSASGLGQPTSKGAPMANVCANVANNSERSKRLGVLSSTIDEKGSLGAHELLHKIIVSSYHGDGEFDTHLVKCAKEQLPHHRLFVNLC